ncbi:MAG: hypothetical protein JJE53_01995 [Candidatus Pacebacteria bacterium]|nr:hypothetical protein [Candidatus Paceibacterota bacterium]
MEENTSIVNKKIKIKKYIFISILIFLFIGSLVWYTSKKGNPLIEDNNSNDKQSNDYTSASIDVTYAREDILIAAANKDANLVIALYPNVDSKIKKVEAIKNDQWIKDLRLNLEELLILAEKGQVDLLPAKALEIPIHYIY